MSETYSYNLPSINHVTLHRELEAAGFILQGEGQEGYVNEDGSGNVEIVMSAPLVQARLNALSVVMSTHTGAEPYDILRLKEYVKQGATGEKMIVALWEHVVEGRPEAKDALEVVRQQVKNDIPKPI